MPLNARETTVPSSRVSRIVSRYPGMARASGRRDEARPDPHARRAQRQRRGESATVEDPAGGDDGDRAVHRVHDERHERQRRDGAGVTAGLGALGDDEVAPGVERAFGVFDLAAHRDDEHAVIVTELDDVRGHAESGHERAGAALDQAVRRCA